MFVSIEFCPSENCYYYQSKMLLEHGETFITGCINCTCTDGGLNCPHIICPQLSCPPENQIQETNQCCKFCRGEEKENIINSSFR